MKTLVAILCFLTLSLPARSQQELPQQDTNRLAVVNALWRSPLGRQFSSFLSQRLTNEGVIEGSRNLTAYVFSQGGGWVKRLSALQLLIEDVYQSDLLTQDRAQRIIILQGDIWQRQGGASAYPGYGLFNIALAGMLVSLPFGSPLVRAKANDLLVKSSHKLPPPLRFGKVGSDQCHVTLGDVVSRKAASGYRLADAFKIFLRLTGPISTFYLLRYEYEATKIETVQERLAKVRTPEQLQILLDEVSNL